MSSADRPSDREQHEPVHDAGRDSEPPVQHRVETLRYRRAPRLPVFLILGGALGAVAGMILGVLGPGNVMFTTGQVVGYMIAIFALLGLSVGAIVALVIDRVSVRRAQEVRAHVEEQPSRHPSAPSGTDETPELPEPGEPAEPADPSAAAEGDPAGDSGRVTEQRPDVRD